MKTAPTDAVEALQGLSSLYLNMETEAQVGIAGSVAMNDGRPHLYGMGMPGKSGT
jgi:hypothetical protein